MKRVYKYDVRITSGEQSIECGHVIDPIVHVGVQRHDAVTFWMEVRPGDKNPPRKFEVFATGQDIPLDRKHIGTVQIGAFVWHLYENENR